VLGGFVVGELLPAVQAGGGEELDGIVIALDPTGAFTPGMGVGEISWDLFTQLGDPFTGIVKVAAPR
jgi:hypothetical protein